MIIKREEFIKRFLKVLAQDLFNKLPNEGLLDEMFDKTFIILKRKIR